jgi:Uncharacterized homolog of plant Iojap protein
MENKELALLAAKTLDSKKAIDVIVIDIAEKSSFADYLVIATGSSERQVNALVDDVEDIYAQHEEGHRHRSYSALTIHAAHMRRNVGRTWPFRITY